MVNTYSVMTNHFHILLHVLPERELTDDELASRVAALYGNVRAEECRSTWTAYRRNGVEAAMQRLKGERGALLRRIPYLTLQLIRPVGFTVQIVLKRLCKNFVSAGRGVVSREVPVSDGGGTAIGDS